MTFVKLCTSPNSCRGNEGGVWSASVVFHSGVACRHRETYIMREWYLSLALTIIDVCFIQPNAFADKHSVSRPSGTLRLDSTGCVCAVVLFRLPIATNPTGRVSEGERLASRLAVSVDLGIFPGHLYFYKKVRLLCAEKVNNNCDIPVINDMNQRCVAVFSW